MNLRIEIKAGYEQPQIKEGVSLRTNKPYTIITQCAFIHNGGAYPREIKLSLNDHKDAHKVGFYNIGAESFIVSEYGDLRLARNLELIPEANSLKAAS